MKRLGDRVDSVERKSSWEAPQNNPVRNPNFRRNQNPNVGRVSPEQDIRPPFQENYAEASSSKEQMDDTHINFMGLNDEQQVFLSQEDQEDDDINQFQTKSGESFDFKQGYDTAVFEVHKQYKLRRRIVNVTQPEKTKDKQQPKVLKDKVIIADPSDKADSPSNEVTVEEVEYPLDQQPLDTPPLQHNPSNTPQKWSKKDKS